jgi:LacI family transcriptional regulator
LDKKVTMRQIGKAMGVSTVTVSKALGGKDGVSEAVRAQIIDKAREMGYEYPVFAKAVREGKSFDVGILVADRFFSDTSFYAALYKHLIQHLAGFNCYGILEILYAADERELKLPAVMRGGKADGLIVMGQVSPEYMQALLDTQLPCVFLDFYTEHAEVTSVVSDSVYGTYLLTNHLVQMGHREIGFVGDVHATSSILDRYLGYYKSLIQHGIPLREEWVLPDRDENGYLKEVALPEKMPTAFVCNCDEMGHLFIGQLRRAGYRVPEDVSIVGFDDFLFARLCNPPLTTFQVDQDAMAKAAVKALNKKLHGQPGHNGRIVISGHAVYRDSVISLADAGKDPLEA